MGLPVLFVHISAFRTRPGRVLGIDDKEFDAFPPGLVGQKGAELIEGPVVQPFSLAFAGLSPVPDILEVFDGDSGTGAFGLQNTLFGNGVIHLADLATHYKSWLTRISVPRLFSLTERS